MENGMDSMLDMYLFETNSLIAQLEDILIAAEKDKDFTDEHINEIFRIMHTIKGSSAMMDLNSLMKISHRIEDLFFFIREKGMTEVKEDYRRELFDLVFHSVDYIIQEIAKLENGEPLNENIDDYIANINSYLEKISEVRSSDNKDLTPKNIEVSEEIFSKGMQIFFDDDAGMENLRAFMLIGAIRELGVEPVFEPADVESNGDSAQYILENGFLIKLRDEEEKQAVLTAIQNSVNIKGYELIDLTGEAEGEGDRNEKKEQQVSSSPTQEQQAQQPSQNGNHHTGAKQSLISVNLSKLDKLMAIVGEIVITESMVTSSPDLEGLKLDSFTKSARQLRKLNSELQDIAMSLRMVPVAGVFQKMNRIVRDMCKNLGKDVKLVIEGEETEVDKSIVDNIGDPIMHIVRNSMDHGIESIRERQESGKDPQGTIVLSASHTGSEVIISIEDDGRGIDVEKILDKAEKRGQLVKPRSEYGKKEAIALIMGAGFSTNDSVTEYSGRGVGMDVVRKNIEALGGSVSMSGEPGEGTVTMLKIPLTLAIVAGMETAVGDSTFTIPINNIRQSFKISADEVIRGVDGKEMIKKMDEFLPIIRLHELYDIEARHTDPEDGILIWVEAGDLGYCLFVDELIGEQQVVVKPLPSYLNNYNIKNSGIAGCTIMGNGNISLILDIPNLYAISNGR
ncbi:MAG: chemotaxis protein CheA [Peptostreptococcaceae bacterium]|nr:chemotaxis protein CheA [Peptostreptococcaceae bacterium]